MIPNAAYALGMWAYGNTENASRMTRATLHAVAVTTVLKHVVREPRPSNGAQKVSFPSGHSTSAFAFASTVATSHEWYWGAPAYLLAGLVGYSRMNDNQHYIHDVIAGATIGMAYGYGIHSRSTRKENNDSEKTAFFSPFVSMRTYGFVGTIPF